MEYKIVTSIWGKASGLMFSKKKNLMFVFDKEKYIKLHMWFVFFPIDVLYLDSDKKIVEIKKNFMPFTEYTNMEKAKYIVEIALDKDKRKEYKIGNKF